MCGCLIERRVLTPGLLLQLDRNAIAQARLNGLEDDLGLEGSQYNTCISILFVGYAIISLLTSELG